MKRIVATLIATSIVTGSVAVSSNVSVSAANPSVVVAKPSPGPSTVHAREHARYRESAPGDAYFGRLKMSYLTIDNVFRDESARAADHTVDPDIINKLKDADESLQAWAKAYPRDPELSHSYFLAAAAYKKVWTKSSQEKAWQYMHIIAARFPKSYFGRQVRKDLAIGFTEHYFADALPCTQAQSPATWAPSELPAQKPAANRPKVDIVASPCSTAASSTPTTTAPASIAPSAAASLVPRPGKSGFATAAPPRR